MAAGNTQEELKRVGGGQQRASQTGDSSPTPPSFLLPASEDDDEDASVLHAFHNAAHPADRPRKNKTSDHVVTLLLLLFLTH